MTDARIKSIHILEIALPDVPTAATPCGANVPFVNHWWNTALYVTATRLATSLLPHATGSAFQIDVDFVEHRLSCPPSTQVPIVPSGVPLSPISIRRWCPRLTNTDSPYGLGPPRSRSLRRGRERHRDFLERLHRARGHRSGRAGRARGWLHSGVDPPGT
jgi:hypothetical protein